MICYDANGADFDGPFASQADAQKAQDALSRFDQMVVAGRPPGTTGTDSGLNEGYCNGNQFEKTPDIGNFYRRNFKKAGGRSTRGKVYKSSLARFPGDPQAWVSSRNEVAKIQHQRREAAKREEDKGPRVPIPIADKIVDRHLARELAGHKVTPSEKKKAREKIRERLTPSWKKHLL